jgi:hypothetical protein
MIATIRLSQSSQSTTATVSGLDLGDHGACYYTFTAANGKQYREKAGGCGADYVIGDPIKISYVPSDPSITTTDSPTKDLVTRSLFMVLGPTFLASVVGGGLSLQRRRKGQRQT